MPNTETRAVCLNCIDGRAQVPVIAWITRHHKVAYVDMITEPGMDGLLADSGKDLNDIYKKVNISIKNNNAIMIFIVAHHDCRGNPVSEAVHKEMTRTAVERFQKEFPSLPVTGLWVTPEGRVESQ